MIARIFNFFHLFNIDLPLIRRHAPDWKYQNSCSWEALELGITRKIDVPLTTVRNDCISLSVHLASNVRRICLPFSHRRDTHQNIPADNMTTNDTQEDDPVITWDITHSQRMQMFSFQCFASFTSTYKSENSTWSRQAWLYATVVSASYPFEKINQAVKEDTLTTCVKWILGESRWGREESTTYS